jgi:hypothetical protein
VGAPVVNGQLGQWDTTGLQNGPHTLRLLVRDNRGAQFEARVRVFVENNAATPTLEPTATWTPEIVLPTPIPPQPTNTPVPEVPTNTPVVEPPTNTPVPEVPTNTPVPEQPTNTPVPEVPTNTPVMEPPTNTPVPEVPPAGALPPPAELPTEVPTVAPAAVP